MVKKLLHSNLCAFLLIVAGLTVTLSCNSGCYDVLIVGGGASGTAAAIQASRLGAKTIVIEETPWLGGMLTSAGVSCVDGNYKMRSGIFGEFTDSLAARYGGYDKLKTGWVSHINFEPHVGKDIFANMVASVEKPADIMFETSLLSISREGELWTATVQNNTSKRQRTIKARVVIDGTELGDVAGMLGLKCRTGMDSRYDTGESIAPEEANDVIQDLTYVVILKDYGKDADMTIPRPESFDPEVFANSAVCQYNMPEKAIQRIWPARNMITYGALPNSYYMINWPIEGNDFYTNSINCTKQERDSLYALAKDFSLKFVYFIQHELGMKNLGIADDVYPTEDGLPFFPYHRESRRVDGEAFFTVDAAAKPYDFGKAYYRTGIAVGDYAVDHHHFRHPDWESLPDLHFYPIPSFNLPAGTIIPKDIDNFIVAEKSISVSNLVNGTTRLQPVVMQIGQAAGALAALATTQGKSIREIGVRELQKSLLSSSCYIMPYLDLPLDHKHFKAIQRIGACGIMRGEGKNVGWSNETWFNCSDELKISDLYLDEYFGIPYNDSSEPMSVSEFMVLVSGIKGECLIDKELWENLELSNYDNSRNITRYEAAVIIDAVLNPFALYEVNYDGELVMAGGQ